MPIWSCLDGLICISPGIRHDPGTVMIYNPIRTGDYVCLPESKNHKEFAPSITLGFDHSINKYKVVKIMNNTYFSFVDVFAIGKDISWRRLDLSRYSKSILFYGGGIFHQGSIYWVIRTHRAENMHILEFDLTTEMFATIDFPKSMKAPWRSYGGSHWQSLGECLVLIMLEYRSVRIWRLVKEVSTSTVVGYKRMSIEEPYEGAALNRLVCLNNNEDFFLLQSCGGFERVSDENQEKIKAPGTHFSLYDPATEKNRLKNLPNLQSMFLGATKVQLLYFKPSLISIKEAMLKFNPLSRPKIPKTREFPTQIQDAILFRESGIGSGHTVRIDFCASCSYRGTAVTMKNMLEASFPFPGINVILENYRAPLPKPLLGTAVPVFEFGVIVLLIGSGQIFPGLGFAASLASWYYSSRTNRSGTFLGKSCGAFEVSCDGVQVFSKSREKRFPSEVELEDLVSQRVRVQDKLACGLFRLGNM